MAVKRHKRLFALTAAAGMVLCGIGCPDKDRVLQDLIKPPTITVTGLHVRALSAETVSLLIGLDVHNPNPIGLTLARVEYNLEVAGRPLADGVSDTEARIKPAGVSAIQAPLNVAYPALKDIYAENLTSDYLDYTLTGKICVATPVGDLPIPYRQSGRLPIVRPPQVMGVGLKVDELSLAGAAVTVRIQLFNPNGCSLEVEKFSYRMALEGRDFAAGELGDQTLAPRAAALLDVPVKVDFVSGLSWALALISRKKAGYDLQFDAEYLIDGRPVTQSEHSAGALDFSK